MEKEERKDLKERSPPRRESLLLFVEIIPPLVEI
jgi:hypothetical protein